MNVANVEMLPVPMLPMAIGAAGGFNRVEHVERVEVWGGGRRETIDESFQDDRRRVSRLLSHARPIGAPTA